MVFPSEGASFQKPYVSSCGLAEDVEQPTHRTTACAWPRAVDFVTSGPAHVCEEGARVL